MIDTIYTIEKWDDVDQAFDDLDDWATRWDKLEDARYMCKHFTSKGIRCRIVKSEVIETYDAK